MLELQAIIGIANSLHGWFGTLSGQQRERREDEKAALRSLYAALNETRIYIGRLSRPSVSRIRRSQDVERNEEIEARISRLWTEASVSLRDLDRDLAERCLLKGDYWANPEAWSEQDIARARIGVNRVFKDAQKLL